MMGSKPQESLNPADRISNQSMSMYKNSQRGESRAEENKTPMSLPPLRSGAGTPRMSHDQNP